MNRSPDLLRFAAEVRFSRLADPMDQYMISDYFEEIKGDEYEHLFFVTLFTGLRKGEVLGLTWDAVDFSRGTLLIDKQLQRPREGDGRCKLVTTKNGKARKLKPAKEVMNVLYRVKKQQQSWQLQHGECFQNPMNPCLPQPLSRRLADGEQLPHRQRP